MNAATVDREITRNAPLAYLLNHLELEVLDGGYAVLDRTWLGRDVCSPFSRLYYILSGEGTLSAADGRELRMTGGMLYFIPSGMTFSYRCDGSLEQLFFHVTVRGADRYDLLTACDGFLSMPSAEAADGTVARLFREKDPLSAIRLESILWRDVSALLSMKPPSLTPFESYSPLIRHAIGYIRAHLSNRLQTGEIAEALFVSPSCLSSHFRREVGVSVGRYVDDMVFFRARELLLRDSASIGEISARLGFCDQFYFARKFRRLHGQSPIAFRRRQRECL